MSDFVPGSNQKSSIHPNPVLSIAFRAHWKSHARSLENWSDLPLGFVLGDLCHSLFLEL